eukprot:7683719-Lingulodinium_polyedra.AAC.1
MAMRIGDTRLSESARRISWPTRKSLSRGMLTRPREPSTQAPMRSTCSSRVWALVALHSTPQCA